jgi:hypothetical protein
MGEEAVSEFRFLWLNVVQWTVGVGVFLVVWGALFSIRSKSMTSVIPAMIGLPILLSGLVAHFKPEKRKLFHARGDDLRAACVPRWLTLTSKVGLFQCPLYSFSLRSGGRS